MGGEKYSKNNINQVIFQIKFYPLLKLYSNNPEVASDFQQVVINEFPELNIKQSRNISIKLDSTGLPIEGETKPHLIWNFKNENGKFINLSGDDLSLTYPGNIYDSFDLFLEDIKLAIKGLKLYNIPKVKSIGLRYVNQIKLNEESKLKEYINPELHMLNYEDNEKIIQSISKIEFDIDPFLLSFQYGLFNPRYPEPYATKDFILDYDCMLRKGISVDKLEDCLVQMNEIVTDKFENSIKEGLREEMR